MNYNSKVNILNEANIKSNIFNNNLNNNFNDNLNNQTLLVSKKIDTYFNDLLQQPEITNIKISNKNEYTFSKFYDEYIEHNILLLFIIFALVVFLIIKYYNKYYSIDNFNNQNLDDVNYTNDNNNDEDYDDENNDENDYNNNLNTTSKYSNKVKRKKRQNKNKTNSQFYKEQLKEKQLLELEKKSILDIIDELSSMNYSKMNTNTSIINKSINNYTNDQYFNKSINDEVNNYNDFSLIAPNPNSNPNLNPNSNPNENLYTNNTMGYLNINKNINYKDKKNPNVVNGVYIDSPFEE